MPSCAAGAAACRVVGVQPEELDSELGWIVPSTAGPRSTVLPVARFREKPTQVEAAALLAGGGVVNTFLFAAHARALWDVCERLIPEVARPLATAQSCSLRTTYAELPSRDFSKTVLEASAQSLAVVTARSCGWSDLGTPERVARCLRRGAPRGRESAPFAAALNLSQQLASASFAG